MRSEEQALNEEINHLYRHEYGKIVAVLTKAFGAGNMDLAEDVAQDAMMEAVQQWSYQGIPDNPVGWIYKVAKFKAINIIRKERLKIDHQDKIRSEIHGDSGMEPQIDFDEEIISDDQLKMIFTCCNPSLSADSQVALTLKTLCGFSISELAQAFLSSEESINKRLVRARKQIRESNIPFDLPDSGELEKRLMAVLEVIYLMFNEGYQSSRGNEMIRFELCEESIRLAEILAAHSAIHHKSSIFALLALMSFNAARFDSRMDEVKVLVDLEHQERSRWNQELINKGLVYLELSSQEMEISLYHILATISGHHCTAKTYEQTDWQSILELYDNLLSIDDSAVVKLNRAIVLSKIKGPKEALKSIDKLKGDKLLKDYLPYYMTKADLYYQTNQREKAQSTLHLALNLNINDKFKSLINNKLSMYRKEE